MKWSTPSLPELCGVREAVELFGVSRSTITRWRQPGSGPHGPDKTYLPPPKYVGARDGDGVQVIWTRDDLLRCLETYQRAGRKQRSPKPRPG